MAQNEANSGRGRLRRGPRGVGRGAIVRNKANSGSGKEVASALRERSYGELFSPQASAKQSQFGDHGRHPEANRAKRSQFALFRPT